MERRNLIKGLGGLFGLSVLPAYLNQNSISKKKFHFVGLGTAGTNVIKRVKEIGICGEYSCITWFSRDGFTISGLKHIDYLYPDELRECTDLGRKRIPLTTEMKELLSGDNIYIIFVGVGGFTGTSLITDVIQHLKQYNYPYLAICCLPFKEEGRWRNDYAKKKRLELSPLGKVVFFDNNIIKSKYQEEGIGRMMRLADKEMIKIFKEEYLT